MRFSLPNRFIQVAAVASLLLLVAGQSTAQTSGNHAASDQDKQFLQDLGKDSNFEIKTSQLALQKSSSADVKSYARMVIHDHDLIKAKIAAANKEAAVPAVGATDMSAQDTSMVDKLNGLSGKDFDTAYIQELVKGNDQIEQEEKAVSTESTNAPIKSLAIHSAATDKKHAAAAKRLAAAHHVQS